MKTTWVCSTVLGLAAVVCSNGVGYAQAGTPSKAVQAEGTGTPAADKAFLYKSAQGSMGEIALSEMALKKSKNPELTGYAQQMVTDHQKLLADSKPFADKMGVKTPTKLNAMDRVEADRLSSMRGEKFDQEYVKAMVGGHHADLELFTTELDTTTNLELKPVVAQGKDVVKQHTDMIDGIAQKMGITTPPQATPASGN